MYVYTIWKILRVSLVVQLKIVSTTNIIGYVRQYSTPQPAKINVTVVKDVWTLACRN